MVARVLVPWLPAWRNTITSRAAGDHEGNKCRSQPLVHHPRPYEWPGLLPDFPAEGDAYGAQPPSPLRETQPFSD